LGGQGGLADGVVGVDARDAGGYPGETLHDGVVRLACRVGHARAGLHGTDQGVAGSERQPSLLDLMKRKGVRLHF